MFDVDEIIRDLKDLHRRVDAYGRLESSSSGLPATVAKFSGTPTAGRLAQFTGAGTVEETAYAGSAVARYSGVPTAGQLAYWTGNGTAAAWTSGTADLMLLSGNQTVAGVKTFSDGISFGNETLEDYDPNTWTPVITGSGGNPTVSYTTQSGRYTRIGDVIFFSFEVTISTTSGGSGTMRVSLPTTVVTVNTLSVALISGPDATGTPIGLAFEAQAGQAYGLVRLINDNAGIANIGIADLANGDTIRACGFYFV